MQGAYLMKKHGYGKICLILCFILLCGGCVSNHAVDANVGSTSDNMLIGLSFDSFVIERWQRDRDVFVSTAQSMGAEVNVQIANGSVEEQLSQIEYLIQKKVDALVIIPTDCYAMTEVAKKAQDAGIPVISYDRLIMNAGVDLYISFDNEAVGSMMATALSENLPAGSSILNICGSKADQNVAQANNGFDKVMQNKGIRILRTVYAEGWLAETAYNEVNQAIADGLVFDGVRCGNDDLASQAFIALSEHRLAGKVLLVGQDADLAACQRIVEGTQLMTVFKPVEKLAKLAAESVVKIINGEKIEAGDTIFDGRQMVSYIKLNPIMVTKENIDQEIIDGGFHRREQVYLNMKQSE